MTFFFIHFDDKKFVFSLLSSEFFLFNNSHMIQIYKNLISSSLRMRFTNFINPLFRTQIIFNYFCIEIGKFREYFMGFFVKKIVHV